MVSNHVDTFKTRRAKKLGIPLLNVEFLQALKNNLTNNETIDIKKFIVTTDEDQENFTKTGIVNVIGEN